MKLQKAAKTKAKMRLQMTGVSGSGKTYSALLMAKGLSGSWEKVAIIDTENNSAALYSHLGPYEILSLGPPFSPERFIQAMEICEKAEMEVIIIDSASHEWEGTGGSLQIHEQLGGRFPDWAKVTPRHRAFIDKMLQSPAHIICCTRKKTEWSLDKNERGKTEPRRVGMADVQRAGLEYEMTVVFQLARENHLVTTEKDRTGLFMGQPEFVVTEATGAAIKEWCESGEEAPLAPPLVGKPDLDQVKRIFVLAKEANWEPAQIADFMSDSFGKSRTSDLDLNEYNHLCAYIQKNPVAPSRTNGGSPPEEARA